VRKAVLLSLLLLIIFVAIGCSGQKKVNDETKAEKNEESPSTHAASTVELNSIDDLVKYAHAIVYGTVKDVEAFSEGTNEYSLKIIEELKVGMDAEEIYVYEIDDTLQVGESYLLFLSSFDGGLFPHPIYTSINKEAILRVENKDITHDSPHLPKNMTFNQTIQEIKNSPNLTHQIQPETDSRLLSNTSLRQLTDEADIIAEITPITFIAENKYMKVAEVKVNKNHKGRLDTENSVHLPAFVEVDKEYLVYLTNDDGMLIVNSIDNSVINKSDQQKWDEAMQLLED